ncbi:glycoside hydrolase family 25 protein [Flexithrix dorotheae]|uniref:glycoside hydrolase family 25 protein n=1 Tax=Flexithrix dorotheae TaxID=70993 RepID=UPI00037FACB7|nr:GH25 family lysozyme [Flexithrix dorotheae]
MKSWSLYFVIISLILISWIYFNQAKKYQPDGISIDKKKYPVSGIDLSHYSGNVDFESLQKDEIDFVYLKATEGIDHKDKNFEENYNQAKKYNVRIGFYHFYRFDFSPLDQAKFYLSIIEEKKYQMPLVIDVEEWGNEKTISREEVRKEIALFIAYVEAQTKCKMIVYTNLSGYTSYVDGLGNDIWLCSFRKGEKLDGNWLFW